MSYSEPEILIVEDNKDNSALAEKVLNHYGMKAIIVDYGKQAIDYCENHQPDLILMDLSLPDIDGLTVMKMLRKMEKFEKTPIIALTAHATMNTRQLSLDAGFTDFLTKPFIPRDLVQTIKQYLNI